MNIGLFSDTYLPEVNGVVSSTDTLRKELEKHGHTVYVITTKVGLGVHEWEGKVLRLAGLELKFLYGYSMTSPVHMRAFNEIKKLNLDVIHVQTEFGVGLFGFRCAHKLHIPLIYTYHTTYEDYTHYVNPLNFKRVDNAAKHLVAILGKIYGNSSTEVIVPSVKTKEMLLGYKVKQNIHVVPTGLNIKRFDPKLTSYEKRNELRSSYGFNLEDVVMTFVGRIAQEKQIDLVIDAFKCVHEENKSLKLLVVGAGPEENNLKHQVNHLNLEDVVVFAGKKPADEVPMYYHIADGFISASMTETQGMTFVEALASGLMVFAKDKKVLADLIDEDITGYYFETSEDLASKLLDFAKLSKEDREAKRLNCINKTMNYDEDIFYENIMKVYMESIENYKHEYEVDRINAKEDVVEITLNNGALKQIKLMVSYDTYFTIGIRKGETIDEEKFEKLKADEERVKAYMACIRFITRKDRTIKEVKDYLKEHTECDDIVINGIIERLKERHFLDDELYAKNSIYSMKAALQGKNRIIRSLKKKGVSQSIIESCFENDSYDEEFNNALKYANKIKPTIHGKSIAMKKRTIYQRMTTQGFSNDIINDVLSKINFIEDESLEIENLKMCANKARRRYEKKYEGYELRNSVFRYCVNHGYKMEDIYAVLDEMEWKDHD